MNPEKLTIYVGRDMDGFTFRLRPKSLERIRAFLKHKGSDASPLPQVSIGYDVRTDFESINGSIFPHIQQLLTSLEDEEINQLGGIQLIDPTTQKVLEDSTHEHA